MVYMFTPLMPMLLRVQRTSAAGIGAVHSNAPCTHNIATKTATHLARSNADAVCNTLQMVVRVSWLLTSGHLHTAAARLLGTR
jgi:hypothetical protein